MQQTSFTMWLCIIYRNAALEEMHAVDIKLVSSRECQYRRCKLNAARLLEALLP